MAVAHPPVHPFHRVATRQGLTLAPSVPGGVHRPSIRGHFSAQRTMVLLGISVMIAVAIDVFLYFLIFTASIPQWTAAATGK